MYDLVPRFQGLSDFHSAIARRRIRIKRPDYYEFYILPFYEVFLSFRYFGEMDTKPNLIESNQILKDWVAEQDAIALREAESWIEPVMVGAQVWAYPDTYAVMRVPVELEVEQWWIARPFYFFNTDYETRYSLWATLGFKNLKPRE